MSGKWLVERAHELLYFITYRHTHTHSHAISQLIVCTGLVVDLLLAHQQLNNLHNKTTFFIFAHFVFNLLCARTRSLLNQRLLSCPILFLSFSISLECEQCLYKRIWQWYVRFYDLFALRYSLVRISRCLAIANNVPTSRFFFLLHLLFFSSKALHS